jgi:iron-sulfur cluster assembly protein
MFTLTRAAALQIRQAAQDSAAESLCLRVAARQTSDGSIDYGMGFDDAAEQDIRLQFGEVDIVIAPHHATLLEGTVLDFVELEPGQFNFIFMDSAEAKAGGCASQGCGSGACSSGGCGGATL